MIHSVCGKWVWRLNKKVQPEAEYLFLHEDTESSLKNTECKKHEKTDSTNILNFLKYLWFFCIFREFRVRDLSLPFFSFLFSMFLRLFCVFRGKFGSGSVRICRRANKKRPSGFGVRLVSSVCGRSCGIQSAGFLDQSGRCGSRRSRAEGMFRSGLPTR